MLVAGEASPRPPSPPRFCPAPLPCFRYASSAMDAWVCQAEAWAGRVEHWICQQTPEQIYLAVAVIAVNMFDCLTASRPKSSKPNTIVLSGLSGSGKTVLFYQLHDGSSHQETVTLMEHNSDTFVLHSELERQGKIKPVHVIDVPGHARLKPKLDEVLVRQLGLFFLLMLKISCPACKLLQSTYMTF
uniref:Signal recognition particle receptor subunit beta n=1 Tax=Triticum urartu TaxID=4572 RepID=A0A8R7V8D5_TRIUA